jgi:HD superfamily phosphohydrolase YqeK
MDEKKQRFITICKEKIKRSGIDDLLCWLEKSDFYYAPASTKFHGNYEGGLLDHSLNVYNNLVKLVQTFPLPNEEFDEETLAIVGLFHDLCKVSFYKKGSRNVKGEDGKWYAKEIYEINEKIPLGHGEKSCILLQQFIKLNIKELLSIRWHMGGFDSATKGGDYGMSGAQDYTHLVTLLQAADMLATMTEVKID